MNFGGAVHPITFPYGLFLPAIILCWFSFDLWVSHWGGGGDIMLERSKDGRRFNI